MSVTPAMIATALGVAVPAEDSVTYGQWSMWVDDALMLIENRAAELNVTVDSLSAAKVDYVVREAVVAHARHPGNETQVSTRIDDGSISKSYRSGAGRVAILDEWWTLLGLTPSGGGAFAVDTVPSASRHLPWCSLAFGATYCSCGTDIAGYPIYEVD